MNESNWSVNGLMTGWLIIWGMQSACELGYAPCLFGSDSLLTVQLASYNRDCAERQPDWYPHVDWRKVHRGRSSQQPTSRFLETGNPHNCIPVLLH